MAITKNWIKTSWRASGSNKTLRSREENQLFGNNIAKITLFKQIRAISSTPFGIFERIKGCEFDDNC